MIKYPDAHQLALNALTPREWKSWYQSSPRPSCSAEKGKVRGVAVGMTMYMLSNSICIKSLEGRWYLQKRKITVQES